MLKNIVTRKYVPVAVCLAAVIAIAVALLTCEHHQLWKIQEQNLFLWTPLFFRQQMVEPGGMLTWMGACCTQFLYQPWLGVTLLCGWWLLLIWVLQRAFRMAVRWMPLLLTPVALLLIANVDMGYWIYTLKLHGWFFVPTIGTTAVVALLWGFRRVVEKTRGTSQAEPATTRNAGVLSKGALATGVLVSYVVVVAVAGYPLLGTYALVALLALLLMAVWVWRIAPDRWKALGIALLAVLMAVAVPLLCYRYVYYQTNLESIYWVGMPVFTIFEAFPLFYIPYGLLAVFMLVLGLSMPRGASQAEPATTRTGKGAMATGDRTGKGAVATGDQSGRGVVATGDRTSRGAVVINVVWVLCLIGGVAHFWFKDENFRHEVAMLHYVEETRWDKVLEEAASQEDEPTRAVVMLRNLALSRLGRQGDMMYQYPDGSKRPASPFPIRSSLVIGTTIYYHYGMLNDCHHLCVESGVEYGWRVEHLKMMARCAMLSGNVKAMHKYTGLLKHTLYHDRWATLIDDLQRDPDRMAEARETAPVIHMLYYPNVVGSDNGLTEKYLMDILSKSDADAPYFQEQCLLATLWTRDIPHFWHHLAHYAQLHPDGRLPRHYQEAACVFAYEDPSSALAAPVDANIKASFGRFMQQLQQYDDRPIDEVQAALRPLFGDTYFYDYYLMGQLTYY